MKKTAKSKAAREVTPEEAVQFLEDFRKLSSDVDEPTVAISIRIPGNVLRALKTKAKARGMKYQSLMVQYVRKGLSSAE